MDEQVTYEMPAVLTEVPRNMTYTFIKDRLEKTDDEFTINDVYVVWFCKTLQNWKALVSTTLPDGMYYELTCDGDAKKVYIDSYKKFENASFDLIDP